MKSHIFRSVIKNTEFLGFEVLANIIYSNYIFHENKKEKYYFYLILEKEKKHPLGQTSSRTVLN